MSVNAQQTEHKQLIGTYGAYADPSTFTELTLNSDGTYKFHDQFELGGIIDCTGTWKTKGNQLTISNCESNSSKAIPQKWDIKDGNLIGKIKKSKGEIVLNPNSLTKDSAKATNTSIDIIESITLINKGSLFNDWQKLNVDTLNPTSIKIDINGDAKIDLIGFFEGIEYGLFIIGDFERDNGEIFLLFQRDFGSDWLIQNELQCVITPINAGQIINELDSETPIVLVYDSAHILMNNGSELVITYIDNDWKEFRIK